MNIVHLLLTGQPGGIEILAYNIALRSRNKNIMYFIFSGGTVADAMQEAGIPVVIANTPRYRWNEKIEQFVQYCKDEKIDAVVNHLDSPVACAYVCALKKAMPDMKILSYLHCDSRDVVKGLKGQLVYKTFGKQMHKRCDKVVAISEFVKQTGMTAYDLPSEKIVVIYNGVDISRFCVSAEPRGDGPMELIFVGRLIREKGVHLLLEALSQLPESMKIHATIVGFGPEYENLRQQAKNQNLDVRVDFLGKRMDVSELLAKADYFVHPATLQEGFGITLVEAMAVGKPCIASDGGAIQEVLDSTTGFLFTLGSVSDLVEKITEAYSLFGTEKYESLSRAARKRAECFSIDAMISSLEALY